MFRGSGRRGLCAVPCPRWFGIPSYAISQTFLLNETGSRPCLQRAVFFLTVLHVVIIVYRKLTINSFEEFFGENMGSTKKSNKDPLGGESFAKISKALGHPARIKIIKYLKEANQCICGEIVEIMPLAQSTVSQHLKQLKESGLVIGEVEGPTTCYCLDLSVLKAFKEAVDRL